MRRKYWITGGVEGRGASLGEYASENRDAVAERQRH